MGRPRIIVTAEQALAAVKRKRAYMTTYNRRPENKAKQAAAYRVWAARPETLEARAAALLARAATIRAAQASPP